MKLIASETLSLISGGLQEIELSNTDFSDSYEPPIPPTNTDRAASDAGAADLIWLAKQRHAL